MIKKSLFNTRNTMGFGSPVLPPIVMGSILVSLLLLPDSGTTRKEYMRSVEGAVIFVPTLTVSIYTIMCIGHGGGTCPMYAWFNSIVLTSWLFLVAVALMYRRISRVQPLLP